MTYYTTDIENLSLVINDGYYIGENMLVPKQLSNAVRAELGLVKLRYTHFCYYGEPDSRLKKVFGYD